MLSNCKLADELLHMNRNLKKVSLEGASTYCDINYVTRFGGSFTHLFDQIKNHSCPNETCAPRLYMDLIQFEVLPYDQLGACLNKHRQELPLATMKLVPLPHT